MSRREGRRSPIRELIHEYLFRLYEQHSAAREDGDDGLDPARVKEMILTLKGGRLISEALAREAILELELEDA